MEWAKCLVECLSVSNASERESEAVVKLITRQPITKPDAAHLLHMINTNPISRLDDIDICEFQEWIAETYGIEVSYLNN